MMRVTTEVYVSMRQVGVPGSETVEGPLQLKAAIMSLARYLGDNSLRGSHFEFRVATNKAATNFNSKVALDADPEMLSLLEGIFAEEKQP